MQIANRESFAAARKKGAPTARSYVQDGLVALFDGIENAGWGVHDPSATTWVNLAGGPAMSFNGGLTVGDNYMRTTSGYGEAALASALRSTNLTIEFVAARNFAFGSSNAFYSESMSSSEYVYASILFYTSGQIYYNRKSQQWYVAQSNFPAGAARHFSFSVGGGNALAVMGEKVLKSGAMAAQTQTIYKLRTTYTGGSDKLFHSLRRYSRALTAAEIAANYAIDKERFNLP